jgi:hypothetical protein
MKYRLSQYFFLVLILVTWGCDREEDTSDPVIEYIEPEALSVINMPENLLVKAHITDDRRLDMVVLNLLNEDKIPCVMGQYFYPGNRDFNLSASIVLEDKELKTGKYEIQIVASDGTNIKFQYREILIKEIPEYLYGYIALTAPLSFKTNLYRLDPNFEADTQFVIPDTYHLSGVHSTWDEFYFVSDEPSVITAYDVFSLQPGWEIDAVPPRTLFTDIYVDKELLFSTANGDAAIVSKYGSVVVRTPVYPEMTMQCLSADENYIYASHQSLSGAIHQLTVYYRVTGVQMDERQLPEVILDLAPLDKTVLVFMDAAPGFKWIEYNPQDFTLTDVGMLENESLLAVEKISEYRMFLITERCVMVYNYLTGQLSDYTDQPVDFCRYDPNSGIVFLGRDKTVTGIDLLTGMQVEEISFPDQVVDFHILYVK